MSRRLLEIESLADFDAHIGGTSRLNGWFVQSVDLTGRLRRLAWGRSAWAVSFSVVLSGLDIEDHLRRSRALCCFPRLPDLPFDPYRAQLYDAAELYGDRSYAESPPDAAIYAWSRPHQVRSLTEDLARSHCMITR